MKNKNTQKGKGIHHLIINTTNKYSKRFTSDYRYRFNIIYYRYLLLLFTLVLFCSVEGKEVVTVRRLWWRWWPHSAVGSWVTLLNCSLVSGMDSSVLRPPPRSMHCWCCCRTPPLTDCSTPGRGLRSVLLTLELLMLLRGVKPVAEDDGHWKIGLGARW